MPNHETCPWLVERASNNPEPDSIADTIKIVECGAKMLGGENWETRKPYPECEAGHTFPTNQQWANRPEFAQERRDF